MRIKSQYILSIIIFGVVLAIISASVIITNEQVTRISSEEQTANNINTGASNLAYIWSEYFLTNQNSEVTLWQNQFASLSNQLLELNPGNPEQQAQINSVKTDLQNLGTLFNNSVSYIESIPQSQNDVVHPALQVYSNNLNVQSQALAFDASVLSNSLASQASQVKQTDNTLIFALLGAFAAYFIAVYFVFYRRTLRSITNLQDGTKIVGSGNLDYSIALQSNDEIGELSQAFNQMTTNLKTVTASKTDLEQAQASLRESEQRWATTVSSIGDAVITTDLKGDVTFLNSIAEGLTGWSLDEATQKPLKTIFSIVNEQTRREVEDPVSRILKEGCVVGLANHTILIRKDGSEVPIDDSGAPIKDKEGKTTGVVLIFRNIAERKKAEGEIRRLQDYLLLQVERMPIGLIVWGPDFRVQSWNPEATRIFGFTDEDAMGRHPYELIVPKGAQPLVDEVWGRLLKGDETANSINENITKDGKTIICDWSNTPLKKDDGTVLGVMSMIQDVTERKKAQEKVKSQNEVQKGVNTILKSALTSASEEQLGQVCLEVAEQITGSKFGFIGEINEKGLKDIAISNPGWEACKMTDQSGHRRPPGNFEIHGIYGRVLVDGKGFFTNDPASHSDSIGVPEGHPPLKAFLGVPLKQNEQVIGMIALGNREGGYTEDQLEALETIAPAVVQAFSRKRAEEALSKSEERWSTTLSSIGDAVIATDVEGKITFMNNVAQALTGCSLAEAAHKPLQEIFHIVNEETRSEVENPVLKVLQNGAIVGLANHSVLIRKDGSEVPIDDSGSPIRDQTGQVTGVVLVFHDITERKKAEAQLERQAELINLDPDAILARKPDGTITFWSCGAERLYGYTEEEALGQVSQRLLGTRFPADFELKDIIEQIKTTGAWSGELVQRTKDPREITVQSHWAIRVGENNEIEFLESNVDVTDRVQLQERLEDKAAEVEEYATRMEELVEERTNRVKRQASLIDLTPDAIMVRDFDGNISFWSAGAEKLYGWTAKEAVGQVSQDLLKTIFLDPVLDIAARIGKAGSWTGELRQKTKDGREVVVESRWLAEKNQIGRIIDILESNVDITERKKAEVAVQSERQRLYDVLETMPAMVCLITPDYHIAFANLSFRERFGESKGRPCYEYCWGQSEPCKFCESLVPFKTGKPHTWEVTGPDGTVIEAHDYPFTDIDGKQLVLEMDIDITARKKAEAQAIESARKLKDTERLAAIGATAGMVGHDIRNPLQAITGDVYLAKSELDALPDSEEKKSILECLDETEKNIDYINKIVQDLQDYARPLNPKAEESDLREVLEKMVSKNRLPSSIKVKIQVAEEARKISADSYYLNRILYNLFTNAVQAMPKGGKLTLKAERVAGETVITVQDTGVGIPKDIQPKLFTIMFTTKSKGQGFGLPVVKRMIESLGGTVTFESLEGKGTTFTIRLPVKNQ